jgi:DNA-binding transcriptional MerR regulator
MFKIGEFSKLTQVSIRMLRYYDETELLKPAFIDKFTGYRMYSVEQLPRLHKILFLRDTGFTTTEIIEALNHWEQDTLSKHLMKKQNEIQERIQQEQEKLTKLEVALKDLTKVSTPVQCNVILKSIPSYQVLSLRKTIPTYFHEEQLWTELSCYVKENSIKLNTNLENFAIYHDTDYRDVDVDVEVCVPTNQSGKNQGDFIFQETDRIETMACIMVYGPYNNIGPAYEAFAHWLTEHNQYHMTGKSRQICHRGPWNEEDPSKYLVELQIPIIISF